MSHLLPREAQTGAGPVPKTMAYFCGSMLGHSLHASNKPIRARRRAADWLGMAMCTKSAVMRPRCEFNARTDVLYGSAQCTGRAARISTSTCGAMPTR